MRLRLRLRLDRMTASPTSHRPGSRTREGRLETVRASLLGAYAIGLAASITLSEAMLVALACLLLVSGRDARGGRLTWPLALPMLSFAAATIVSALASASPWASLMSARSLWHLGAVWVVLGTLRDAAAARRFVSLLFTMVAVVGVFAIVQVALCGAARPDWAILAWFFHKCERARGFFSTPLTEAGVLIMLLAATLPRLLHTRVPSVWLWCRWLLSVAALALTYIRGAWIGFALSAGLTLLTARRRLLTVVSVVAVLIVLLLALPGTLQRARTIGDLSDPTTADRVAMIRAGLHMLRDYPVLGTGIGLVKQLYPRYATPDAIRRSTGHLHNTPLQILVERGAPGLLAWLAIWVAFFVRAGRALTCIPRHATEDWLLLLGCILATASFLTAGLFEYNFGDTEVLLVVCSFMGVAFVIERDWGAGRQEPQQAGPALHYSARLARGYTNSFLVQLANVLNRHGTRSPRRADDARAARAAHTGRLPASRR